MCQVSYPMIKIYTKKSSLPSKARYYEKIKEAAGLFNKPKEKDISFPNYMGESLFELF